MTVRARMTAHDIAGRNRLGAVPTEAAWLVELATRHPGVSDAGLRLCLELSTQLGWAPTWLARACWRPDGPGLTSELAASLRQLPPAELRACTSAAEVRAVVDRLQGGRRG